MEAATTTREWDETPDSDEINEVVRPLDPVAGDSVLDSIRKRRGELAEERFYDLEVPGYNGCLVLRCDPIEPVKLAQARERMTKMGVLTSDFGWAADLIISACREVLARRHPEDELESIDPTGEPVRIDTRLAELLGVEAKRARDLLRALFDKAPTPDVAIERAQMNLYQWSSGAELEVEEDLLGES